MHLHGRIILLCFFYYARLTVVSVNLITCTFIPCPSTVPSSLNVPFFIVYLVVDQVILYVNRSSMSNKFTTPIINGNIFSN